MATMNVSLLESMKEFVEAQASKEGFGPVSESLRSIIREALEGLSGEEIRP
jgi:Arc/MetJ-type ribon-helix-helix transcriptional regulator